MFLTGRDSFCFHEPSVEKESIPDLFASRHERCVCAVDTAAYLSSWRPDAECFALVRDKEEIAASLQRCGLVSPHYKLDVEYDRFMAAIRGMSVLRHDWFKDEEQRRYIFEAVTKQPYDKCRSGAISNMNIQRDLVQFFHKVF